MRSWMRALGCFMACVGLFSQVNVRPAAAAACPDIAHRSPPHLNVLTINLFFTEIQSRNERLAAIAEFVADPLGDATEPVDVILLQEVVGGILAQTANSARDLKRILRKRHRLIYETKTAFETGIPSLLSLANATLSRCDIDFKLVKRLPRASELEFRGRVIKLPRNVMLTPIRVPGMGKVNIYNTHLTANGTDDELSDQVDVLLGFIDAVEGFFRRSRPVVLGGDFNIDRFRRDPFDQEPFYDRIIDAGFTDAYAASRTLGDLCNPEGVPRRDEHCTVGVSDFDRGSDLKLGTPRRIDYLYIHRFDPFDDESAVRASMVVFNPCANKADAEACEPSPPSVSNHAGVFVSVDLPE